MAEGFELPETGEERGNNPLVLPVSLTISILAVLVAAVTLLGHRAHTEPDVLEQDHGILDGKTANKVQTDLHSIFHGCCAALRAVVI